MMMSIVNFVVLKVNDIDLSQLPHQQQKTALGMILNEETENVVLELKRKSCRIANNVDYDDLEISKKVCYLKIHQSTLLIESNADNNSSNTTTASELIVNLHLPNSSLKQYCIPKSTQTEDIAFYVHDHLRDIQKDTERLIEREHNIFEESLAPELDIEEITLRKSDSNERLGITVCYNNADDYTEGDELYPETFLTEVYISNIHPDSVAGRDGRLRQGDQILQINGKFIKTRPETETLIAENNNAVTLLVSRYLYGDEDDFNDPSTNEDEDEILVVEDYEDDEDDEFYEENNMSYANCMVNKECCINLTDDLDKALLSQVVQEGQSGEKPKEDTTTSTIPSNPTYQCNAIKCTSDFCKEKLSENKNKWPTATTYRKCGRNLKTKKNTDQGRRSHDEYNTEHIYETIPEDLESEPFYCSPYDSSVCVTAMSSCSSSTITNALPHLQQKQRVAHWIGIKPLQEICSKTAPQQSVHNSNGLGHSWAFLNKIATGTEHSAVTNVTNGSVDCCLVTDIVLPTHCQVEDQDNSSSAYNTGGSNNSFSPLTLMLQPKTQYDQNDAPTSNPPISSMSDGRLEQQHFHQTRSVQPKTGSPKDKYKITSPKAGSVEQKINNDSNKMAVMEIELQSTNLEKNAAINIETSVRRDMVLKKHLINQKMAIEKSMQPHPFQQRQPCYYQQQSEQMPCSQFTAPNLSQYHFVSSQEVNSLSLNNKIPKSSTKEAATITNPKKDEEAMVWKVKRRPDGTRYIVRRPAKNRVIKERNKRLNVERLRNDITTTEDDTISEIKTGRYWPREERKKHMEKAKERKQQQQQLFQQQNKTHIAYDNSTAATLCIGDITNKILKDSCKRGKFKQQPNLNFIRQQQQIAAHQQEHYQLHFNSAEDKKHSTSPKKKPSSTLPITSEEFSNMKTSEDKINFLNTAVVTPSEPSQVSSSLQTVTTT